MSGFEFEHFCWKYYDVLVKLQDTWLFKFLSLYATFKSFLKKEIINHKINQKQDFLFIYKVLTYSVYF